MVNQPFAGIGLDPVAARDALGLLGPNQTVVEPSASASAAGEG